MARDRLVRDDRNIEFSPQFNNGLQNGIRSDIPVDTLHELHVDLDVPELGLGQIAEIGVADAEIIKRDTTAEFAQARK